MEKWFKDFIGKKLSSSKRQMKNPEDLADTVLRYPENYSDQTKKIAISVKNRKGSSNANNR
jgi:hypothetical protein